MGEINLDAAEFNLWELLQFWPKLGVFTCLGFKAGSWSFSWLVSWLLVLVKLILWRLPSLTQTPLRIMGFSVFFEVITALQ